MTKEELMLKAKEDLVTRGEEVTLENLKHEIVQGLNQTSQPWPSYKEMKACVDQHQKRSA